jgi:hypothetical protein
VIGGRVKLFLGLFFEALPLYRIRKSVALPEAGAVDIYNEGH